MKQIRLKDEIIIIDRCGSSELENPSCLMFCEAIGGGTYCKLGVRFNFERQLHYSEEIPKDCPLEDYKEEVK